MALSGGKASAYCADWAFRHYSKEDIILYFNDTKWEHKDLYRFLTDLEVYFDHKITYDSDGRSVEQLFHDNHALANNRMPFCSRILKAKRLQEYYQEGDVIVFGIGSDEMHRAKRLVSVYQGVAAKRGVYPKLSFPLIKESVSKRQIDSFLVDAAIEEPAIYKLGFLHNNCSGGCVRAGKKQWKLLYEKLPEVYAERERVEREMRASLGKDIHFLKNETLEGFRGRIERNELSSYYDDSSCEDTGSEECIGICETLA